ncbi:hypothetical protein JXL83_10325 [candidate division WOR-3 bacterium]|nr:hypothetical protein [candidate division WOR-3 bacterium]
MNRKIIDRIIKQTGAQDLVQLLVDKLSFGELQSLLLKVFELKTKKKRHKDVLSEYRTNRFSRPSDISPLMHRKFELAVFSLLPTGFETIDLSPLTPLGTTSVLTPVHQNNVISTVRNTEVAADTTNILALECAKRRGELLMNNKKNNYPVKLCSSQRVTRAQMYENRNFSAFFNIIALCTAGRDTGNDGFENTALEEHVMFYTRVIEELIEVNDVKRINIKFYNYGNCDNLTLIGNIKNKLKGRDKILFKTENDSSFGRNYYSRLRFNIGVVNSEDKEFDYIDGGFTDWTSDLLNSDKERLLTSAIGTDYLLRSIRTV